MGCLCCFPRLIRWFEGFQRLNVNEGASSLGHDGAGTSVEYVDITQTFIEETSCRSCSYVLQIWGHSLIFRSPCRGSIGPGSDLHTARSSWSSRGMLSLDIREDGLVLTSPQGTDHGPEDGQRADASYN